MKLPERWQGDVMSSEGVHAAKESRERDNQVEVMFMHRIIDILYTASNTEECSLRYCLRTYVNRL